MKKTSNAGVTLMELLITAALAGILLTVGIGSMGVASRHNSTNVAAKQLYFALQDARYYAKNKGIKTQVKANYGEKKYQIFAGTQELTNSANFDATSGELPNSTKILYNTCSQIYFDVNGSLTDSNGNISSNYCVIFVGYDMYSYKRVIINPGSGKISYE